MEYTCYYLNSMEEKDAIHDSLSIWNRHKSQELKDFNIQKLDETVKVHTMCCYSKDYLYVLLKTNQDKLVKRDRGYQNGDGFHFVISKPKNFGKASEEFYVIGISPLSKNWDHCFIWYRNIDLEMKPLRNSKVIFNKHNDEIYFTIQINWNEISPFKPFIYDKFGFNISYVQALSDGKSIYMLKEDNYIQCEQSKREFIVYEFQQPYANKDMEIVVDVKEKHIEREKNIHVDIGINALFEEKINLSIKSEDGINIDKVLNVSSGLNTFELLVDTKEMKEGKNKIYVNLHVKELVFNKFSDIYIYEMNSFERIIHEVEILKAKNKKEILIQESITTLEFQYYSLLENLKRLYCYESFDGIGKEIEKIHNNMETVKNERHLFKQGKVMRLAFKSSYDETLQPYTIYIPNSFKDNYEKKLIVFLHGSGSDDTSVFNNEIYIKLAEEYNAIIAAPFARGTSHSYCPKECLEDIVEITNKLASIFSFDKNQVFLCGFSMGGYGALRVYDYCPQIFYGIIMLSGHYDIPSMFSIKGGPNYLEDQNIIKFSKLPMIIFHGRKDMNCSYEDMSVFINKIQKINPRVWVDIDDDIGHSGLNFSWYKKIGEWLNCN